MKKTVTLILIAMLSAFASQCRDVEDASGMCLLRAVPKSDGWFGLARLNAIILPDWQPMERKIVL